jgi:uroporphyrinogen decarboxylase
MPTKRERVEAVLRREQPDHPPVSFWCHFPPEHVTGPAAIDAHLGHLETYDLDFLKVMNDHPFPRGEVKVVQKTEDLRAIKPIAGDADGFAAQLNVLSKLRDRLGRDVLMTTTVFNPWTVLRSLTQPPVDRHGPPTMHAEDQRDATITAMLKEDRSAVKSALETIAASLSDFARNCIAAGADGIFFSVRDDWVDLPANGPSTYDELVRPLDLRILDAASKSPFNMLHACGRPQNFPAFADYPVQVLNWADRTAGPSIAYARDRVKPAIAGGVDNLGTLVKGTPENCAAEVRDALRQAKTRPIMIVPGCTFDPALVPTENLKAVVAAAQSTGG